MVLRRFDFEADQEQIWNAIKSATKTPGVFRVETFRLAGYAQKLGLETVLGRLADPLDFLRRIDTTKDYQLILNHRIRRDSGLGHFTVFEKWAPQENAIYVHDPQIGPSRKIAIDELLELWRPDGEACETTGNIAVLFFHKNQDPLRLVAFEHWSAFFDSDTGRRTHH